MARSKVISVRLGPVEADLIKREAEEEGVPLSEYVRNAAFGRTVWKISQRTHNPVRIWTQIAELVERSEIDVDTLERLLEDALEGTLEAPAAVRDGDRPGTHGAAR